MSEIGLNVNEIVGHAATDLIENFFTSVGTATKDQIARYKIRFGRGFSRYLTEAMERYSKYKTLINRYDPIDLKENYVPAYISEGGEIFRDEDFFNKIVSQKRLIVEGTAGLGKTLFVRYMFRHAILYEKNFIPILFELRNLHLDDSETLISNLVKQVSTYVSGFNEEHFRFGMQAGKFIVLLDGIDEISLDNRTRYAAEILDLAYRYTEAPILLSTRPDDFYAPWEIFRVAKLLPMTRDQTTLMLAKLQFEPDIKTKFISNITQKYFAQHSEFLSVPLLATLMLLTYSEFSAVPSRIHVFYEQAFQTLFHKHDFIKGAFSRKIESGLDVEQFRRVLAAFCFISYLEERFTFLQYQVIENIKAAVRLCGFECDSEAFLKDLLVTVCVLQRDGNYITFVHRSFQEYFTALFVTSIPPADVFEVIEELMHRGRTDGVVRMALQLNEGAIEQGWLLPKLKALDDVFQKGDLSDLELVSLALGSPRFQQGLVFANKSKFDWNTLTFVHGEYCGSKHVINNDDKYYDDTGEILKYIDTQRHFAERGVQYNRAALAAHKRELAGERFSLSTLPVELANRLRCVREAAAALRDLVQVREELAEKQAERSRGLQKLLSKYKQ
ncbi:NACHT domain-containing protein [Sinorhizobium mexicanum]|uniref:Uncharacterized protein n=1 Tax=Sinorhizobium mexicanum TaxID=375549 RepID=A0A859QGQ8_9HYPH|nr:hypothetical protein [Sinorhizobium mexicanum]MBP1881872.1 hypothetical protein [Sinorhizobium mexicanum]QLL61615.1 hypothetical protein FKV68_09230 [Sinorhizobium mexicanum]